MGLKIALVAIQDDEDSSEIVDREIPWGGAIG